MLMKKMASLLHQCLLAIAKLKIQQLLKYICVNSCELKQILFKLTNDKLKSGLRGPYCEFPHISFVTGNKRFHSRSHKPPRLN